MFNPTPFVMPTLRFVGSYAGPAARFVAPPLAKGARCGLIGVGAIATTAVGLAIIDRVQDAITARMINRDVAWARAHRGVPIDDQLFDAAPHNEAIDQHPPAPAPEWHDLPADHLEPV